MPTTPGGSRCSVPAIYCLEELDQPSGVALSDVALDLATGSAEAFQSKPQADLLAVLSYSPLGSGVQKRRRGECTLLAPQQKPPKTRKVDLRFIHTTLGQPSPDLDAGLDSAIQA